MSKSRTRDGSSAVPAPAVGHVSLLGAGPGDPELITLRALHKLQQADVILYDALVHPVLLEHRKPGAELVFVGKRAGRSSERQSSINEKLIAAARTGARVARLKGGDPYLFGRGSEEAEALEAAGIPFDVVPGVASPMAASAYTGISLTHRDLASSVAYVTATESVEKDESAHDWSKLATATQTLVFFMGLRKLDSLMERLIEHGRDPDTAAAVVSNASLPTQRTVVGKVRDIAQRAREAGLDMPALTIVGAVVNLHARLAWFQQQPLFGKRVLITRPEGQSDEMAQALREIGAEALELPTVRIAPPSDPERLTAHVLAAGEYDWAIFTSVNGVEAFFEVLDRGARDGRVLGGVQVAAIGPATSAALWKRGIRADVVPSEYRGEAVAEAIFARQPDLRGKRVLIPRAEVAREVLPSLLRARGATVDVIPAYRTLPATAERFAAIRKLLTERAIDIVAFTSSSTVERLVEGLGDGASELLRHTVVAAIGPITADSAARLGLPAQIVARDYTARGLIAAMVEHGQSRPALAPERGA
ncbi:MAG: Uroporphyrinogen-III methyltransferase [Myxococcaceae bacterium]|nr:Uroporphyrinogen-III methyltransferase [Myxococcaceae bacterium]